MCGFERVIAGRLEYGTGLSVAFLVTPSSINTEWAWLSPAHPIATAHSCQAWDEFALEMPQNCIYFGSECAFIPTAISFLSDTKQWDQVCRDQVQALATKAWTLSFPTCLWTEYCKSDWSKLLTTGTSLEFVLVVTACTGKSHLSSHAPSRWLLLCLAA